MVSTSSRWHVRALSQNPVPPWTLPLGDATPSTCCAEGALTGYFTNARRPPAATPFHHAPSATVLGMSNIALSAVAYTTRDLVLSLALVQCSDAWRPRVIESCVCARAPRRRSASGMQDRRFTHVMRAVA